ncbi:non-ribosomal peptide synthetase [Hamadaea tsunoensis]|uniref:non-ribosomal peptide synthetase n=1 Tax=Hamadaea tsunoensis TaxID=53368 RepID=UPI00041DF0D1|nr:non-ribosomal peptide synthetase [Hamadaea tsunoensis]
MPGLVPADWSAGDARALPPVTVLDLFAARAATAPDAVAVHSGDTTLTYAELDAAAGSIAGRLLAYGVERGARVGVLVDRSAGLLAALLGVWRAGCVYLPLDVEHPADRTAFLLADARAAAVVADRPVPAPLPVVAPDERHTPGVRVPQPSDPAYLIYTSGSTGRPKAVEVDHAALLNVVTELGTVLRVGPGEHWLSMAPPTFDISLAELCVPVATGATLTITTRAEVRDAARLVRLITAGRPATGGVTRMQAVPSQWQALVDAGLHAPDLIGMTGGEALPARLATALTQRLGGLVNAYGPTETTILSTVWPVPAEPGEIRIGRPIANTRVLVLAEDGTEAAVGEPGELHIGGLGVARGYADAPDLTAAAFVEHPLGRLYRTGDRCRWRTDGNLEYLGRSDSQVKIRGQRVELGEVEAGLERCPEVAAAVALVRGQELIAYVMPADPDAPPTPSAVRDHAARTLPSAMTPTSILVLKEFPLTANGKIDRAALAEVNPVAAAAPVAPAGADPFTTEFCALVAEVLGAGRVGPADDFFEVGGHSLAVMRVVAAISDRWGVEVASDVFYDTETVADLASAVSALRSAR